MSQPTVILEEKRAKILNRYRHPWVFSKGLQQKPPFEAGTQVRVTSQKGRQLGWAFYHPTNSICLRMISFEAEPMTPRDWSDRIDQAKQLRRAVLPADCHSYRLIHGENDGFPGLAVDVYGDVLSLQISSAGMERLRETLLPPLLAATGATAVYERSVGHARHREGLPSRQGFLLGEKSFPFTIEEAGLRYEIDPAGDQKTGFYLDQRPQRRWLRQYAASKRILDLFSYSGGFTLPALMGGAAFVRSLDSSAHALEMLQRNLTLNGLSGDRQENLKTDVFEYLRGQGDERWDMVILDPPALAKAVKTRDRALKAYLQLNRDAARWVKPGGLLVSFSCTGVVSREQFKQSVFLGLREAGREARVSHQFGAGPDHPLNPRFPEGEYLKGFALYLS